VIPRANAQFFRNAISDQAYFRDVMLIVQPKIKALNEIVPADDNLETEGVGDLRPTPSISSAKGRLSRGSRSAREGHGQRRPRPGSANSSICSPPPISPATPPSRKRSSLSRQDADSASVTTRRWRGSRCRDQRGAGIAAVFRVLAASACCGVSRGCWRTTELHFASLPAGLG